MIGWRGNTDDITTQSHSLFTCSREKNHQPFPTNHVTNSRDAILFLFLPAIFSDTVELVITIDDANDNIPVFSPHFYVGGRKSSRRLKLSGDNLRFHELNLNASCSFVFLIFGFDVVF